MLDVFKEDGLNIGFDEWMAIANLKFDVGGEALIQLVEGRIKSALGQLVVVNPNDVGAVAQLQARVNESGVLRDFLKMDPEVVAAQRAEAEKEGDN